MAARKAVAGSHVRQPESGYYVSDRPHDALYVPAWCAGQVCVKCNRRHENAPPVEPTP